jgi:hypothetical protein
MTFLAMDPIRPLRVAVRPRDPALTVRAFAESVLPRLAGDRRIAATTTGEGLVLDCVWQGDFEVAWNMIRGICPSELEWGAPEVQYWTEYVEIEPGTRRQVVLEPRMTVEVRMAQDFAGFVIGELSSRRAMIEAMEDVPGGKIVRAEVPLAELFGYSKCLEQQTGGGAIVSVEFRRYSEAPKGRGPEPDGPAPAALRVA